MINIPPNPNADSIIISPGWAKGNMIALEEWRAGKEEHYAPCKRLMQVVFGHDGHSQYLEGVRFDKIVYKEGNDWPYPRAVLVPAGYEKHLGALVSIRNNGTKADGFILGQSIPIRFDASAHIGLEETSLSTPSYQVFPIRFVSLDKSARRRVLREKGLSEFLFGALNKA